MKFAIDLIGPIELGKDCRLLRLSSLASITTRLPFYSYTFPPPLERLDYTFVTCAMWKLHFSYQFYWPCKRQMANGKRRMASKIGESRRAWKSKIRSTHTKPKCELNLVYWTKWQPCNAQALACAACNRASTDLMLQRKMRIKGLVDWVESKPNFNHHSTHFIICIKHLLIFTQKCHKIL